MNTKKVLPRMLAWFLTLAVLVSTGLPSLAFESETQTETESMRSTEENQSEENPAETESPVTETESQTETKTQSETESETQSITQSETQPITEEKPTPQKAVPRNQPTDRSGDFKVDKLTIKYSGQVIYDEENGQQTGSPSVINKEGDGSLDLNISMNWSQKDPDQKDFIADNYIVFDICTLVSDNDDSTWTNYTSERNLIDEYDNKTILGTAKFEAKKVNDEVKLSYRITFNKNIAGKYKICGSLQSKATVSNVEEKQTVTIKIEDEAVFKWKKTPPTDPGGLPGEIEPKQPGPSQKVRYGFDEENNAIGWSIQWREYLDNWLIDYDSDYKANNYEYVIVEDILDYHQTFRGKESYYKEGVKLNIVGIMYLVDREGLLGEIDKRYTFASLYKGINDKSITYFDAAQMGAAEAEEAVRSQPLSWTLIDEADPGNSGKMRERIVLNVGAPGNGGLRFNAATFGKFNEEMARLQTLYVNIKGVVDKAVEDGKGPDDLIPDWTDANHRKLSDWRNLLRVSKDTYDFYSGEPYINAFNIDVRTFFDPLDPETSLAGEVRNASIMQSGTTVVKNEAQFGNQWNATIRASADPGEVMIQKADALAGYQEGDQQQGLNLGAEAIPQVSFRVYQKDDDTPLKFRYDSGTGKYRWDNSGDEIVKTNLRGNIILTGLEIDQTYTIREAVGAAGYYTEDKEIDFMVNREKPVYKLLNNTVRGVELTKVDAADQGTVLSGAVFELYRQGSNEQLEGFAVETIAGTDYLVYTGNPSDRTVLKTDDTGELSVYRLPAGDYYFKELTAPEGYQLSEDVFPFSLEERQNGNAVVTVTAENKRQPEPKFRIRVTKYVKLDGQYRSMDYSFYAALFSDRECTRRVTEVKEFKLEKSYQADIVFDNLEAGTYYLAETDRDGKPIDFTSEDITFTNEIENGEITLSKEQSEAAAIITNNYKTPPQRHVYEDDGQIIVNKRVVAGSRKKVVTETFYFTLYSDKDYQKPIATKALSLKNKATGQVSFTDLAYGSYYIAESDQQGRPVDGSYRYAVSLDKKSVSLSGDHKSESVTVTNDIGEETTEPETKKPTTKPVTRTVYKNTVTRTSAARTGDGAPIGLYLLLLAATGMIPVGILLRGTWRKHRN